LYTDSRFIARKQFETRPGLRQRFCSGIEKRDEIDGLRNWVVSDDPDWLGW
jgi:hypothetical protein